MTVREVPPDRKRKASAIVSRATLDQQRGAFERLMAISILFFSFAGSVAAISGGWAALASAPRLAPIAGGILAQVALTAAEWWYGSGRGRWRYRMALAIDAALTTIGYGPLFVPTLTLYIASKGVSDLALPLAWIVVGVVSFIVAYIPERLLID
jgi:hypothetical protein